MSTDVAITPRCAECGDVWLPGDGRRWRAYRVDEQPGDQPALGFWCPDCARREFGDEGGSE